jgi:hypothetical protein
MKQLPLPKRPRARAALRMPTRRQAGISSGRLYWENKFPFLDFKNVSIPVAVSIFPGELYQAPRSWTERAYPKLTYYNKVAKGGHYAAWEQPKIFSEEVRAGPQIAACIAKLLHVPPLTKGSSDPLVWCRKAALRHGQEWVYSVEKRLNSIALSMS